MKPDFCCKLSVLVFALMLDSVALFAASVPTYGFALYVRNDVKEEPYLAYRGVYPKIPYTTEEQVRSILAVADHPKAAAADPKVFFDNRFIKELEDSGFIKELYGQR